MIHQPTHPHPYLESVSGSTITFSVIINPRDVIYGYQIFVETPDGTEVTNKLFAAGEIYRLESATYEEPYIDTIYGTESGTILQASCDVSSESKGLYRWYLKLYTKTGERNNKAVCEEIQTPYYYFNFISQPTITLAVPETITTCSYDFSAAYSQLQNEMYTYYKFELYKDDVLIDESPEKIAADMKYTYKSFVPGNYKIVLTVKTEGGKTYSTENEFSVEYDVDNSFIFPKATQDSNNNCIKVDYSEAIYVKGNVNGECNFSENGATLPTFTTVDYKLINETNPLSINSDEFTLYYYVHFSELFNGDIIRLSNDITGENYVVRYDGTNFYYKIGTEEEVAVCPYGESASTIQSSGTTINDFYNTLFTLGKDDTFSKDSVFMYNDIAANHWWAIVLLPNETKFYKGNLYSASEVS